MRNDLLDEARLIVFAFAVLGIISACTTVEAPPAPLVVTTPRPATTIVVPAKPVVFVPAGGGN